MTAGQRSSFITQKAQNTRSLPIGISLSCFVSGNSFCLILCFQSFLTTLMKTQRTNKKLAGLNSKRN